MTLERCSYQWERVVMRMKKKDIVELLKESIMEKLENTNTVTDNSKVNHNLLKERESIVERLEKQLNQVKALLVNREVGSLWHEIMRSQKKLISDITNNKLGGGE